MQRPGDRGGSEGQRIHIGLHLLEFLFRGDTELLLFVDDKQSQVFEFHVFTSQSVGADDDVDLTVFKFLQNLFLLFGTLETVEVFDVDGEAIQSIAKGLVMLQGQHGSGDKHSHLFAVGGGFEGSADGHLGLAEAHVTTDEAVHGTFAFHVAFHIVGGLELVGGVFIDEGGLELGLEVAVGGELETLAALTLGVELDEFASDVLDLALGLGFQAVPGVGAKGAQRRLGAVLGTVFGNLVERMYTYI